MIKAILLLNVLALALVGALFFLMQTSETGLKEVAKSLIAAEQKKNKLQLFERTFQQTIAGREKMKAYFVTTDNLAPFIERLEVTARAADVDYALTATQPTTINNHDALHLTLSVEGSFAKVFYFLNLLENLPYRLEINQAYFGLAGGTSKSQVTLWRASFDANLLSFIN